VTVYSDREKVETWEDLDDLVKRLYGPAPVINRIVTPHLPLEWDEKNQYPWENGEPVLFLGEVVGISVQRWRVIEIKKRYAVQNV